MTPPAPPRGRGRPWEGLPPWAWILLAVLTGFMLLPLYLRYFAYVAGSCASAAALAFLTPPRM